MRGQPTNLRRYCVAAAAATALSTLSGIALAQTTITIESWRNDDADNWNNLIIPAFEKAHPDINVEFNGVAPTEYDAALNAKLEGGSAGDLITCRPFDRSLELHEQGHLASLNDL